MKTFSMGRLLAATALALALPTLSFADSSGGHHMHGAGAPGSAAKVDRTVSVVLKDNYFEPETIQVAAGETVRFRVENKGGFLHEFAIATPAMHEEHQQEMLMLMDHGVLQPTHIDHEAAKLMQASMGHGMHDGGNALLLEPGQSGELIWTFPENGDLEFGCTVPGHYQAGMVGSFILN